MHILITGGTGFIGKALLASLTEHQITLLTRSPKKAQTKLKSLNLSQLKLISNLDHLHQLDPIDAIINLAGEPIADKSWSAQQKKKICSSRWQITQQLLTFIQTTSTPPTCFISGSAVGIYGDGQQQIVTEETEITSTGFSSYVCQQWETIALEARPYTRTCIIRTGIVLGTQGGMLKKLLPPFQWGLGAQLGKGQQYIPWIHIDDMVKAILFLFASPHTNGIFNLCAPNPVTNHNFSQALARQLQRPCFLVAPQWLLKRLMGKSSELLFDSIRAHPQQLKASGFRFDFPELPIALQQLLPKK